MAKMMAGETTRHDIYEDLARVRAPQQERSRRAFEAALEAFEALLRERPLAQVTMQEVADRAGLSITSVYARFDGKFALVLALHERVIATAMEQLEAALADPTLVDAPLEHVVAVIVARAVDFADANAHVFRAVLVASDGETNERAAAFIRAGSERIGHVLAPRLADVSAAPERDVDFAWRSTVAVLQQGWMLWGAEPSRFPLGRQELAQRLATSFVSALHTRRPPRAKGP